MKKYLKDIVELQFGANVPVKSMGDYSCVQGRDFGPGGEYLGFEPMFINESDLRYTRLLRKEDVLFSSKGKLFAAVWNGQIQNAAATSTFLILTIKDSSVLPDYLALYLNSSKAKKYYDLHIKTATVNHIGKKQLEFLEIEIPSLDKQKLLMQIHKLLQEEKKITNELLNKREKILNQLL